MNYKRYRLSSKETLRTITFYMVFDAIIAVLFYDSVVAGAIGILFLPIYYTFKEREMAKTRQKELRYQFVSMIGSISSALTSGLSVPNAFREALSDMIKMYGDNADISKELTEIIRRETVNIPVISGLRDFADRSELEEITDFTAVFSEALKSGGDLNEIIRDTVYMIEEKSRMEEEIEAVLKGKMLEQKVMSTIPFIIIGYLRITSSELISRMYGNTAGIIIMTICLGVYMMAFVISKKIVDIRI